MQRAVREMRPGIGPEDALHGTGTTDLGPPVGVNEVELRLQIRAVFVLRREKELELEQVSQPQRLLNASSPRRSARLRSRRKTSSTIARSSKMKCTMLLR